MADQRAVEPPSRVVQRASAAPDKPPGGKYASWGAYETSKASWLDKHNKRKAAPKPGGGYLYHCTQASNVPLIVAANGLMPKQAAWGSGADASKDGILSMAITEAGAGSMGGKSAMLRVAWTDLVALGIEFKSVFGTEVRTTQTIPLDVLRRKTKLGNLVTWEPLT